MFVSVNVVEQLLLQLLNVWPYVGVFPVQTVCACLTARAGAGMGLGISEYVMSGHLGRTAGEDMTWGVLGYTCLGHHGVLAGVGVE